MKCLFWTTNSNKVKTYRISFSEGEGNETVYVIHEPNYEKAVESAIRKLCLLWGNNNLFLQWDTKESIIDVKNALLQHGLYRCEGVESLDKEIVREKFKVSIMHLDFM